MAELWANNAATELSSGISAATTSIALVDGSAFPAPTGADYCWATIDDDSNIEIVKVTARSGNTVTVTRAQQSTSAQDFSAGARFELRLTKETLEGLGGAPDDADYWVETANGDLSSEVVVGTTGITTAAYGSRQAAAKAGRLFLPNNGFYLERDTGAAWAPWGPIFPMTPPVNGDFSWVNETSASVTATVSTTNGGIHLASAMATSGLNNRIRIKTAPSAPYTITAVLLTAFDPYGSNAGARVFEVGLVFRQSSDGKLHSFVIGYDESTNACYLGLRKWTDATTYSGADYFLNSQSNLSPSGLMHLRIADDNSNRICSLSADGVNFFPVHSIGRTDFLTADQVGFLIRNDATSGSLGAGGTTLLSWKEA